MRNAFNRGFLLVGAVLAMASTPSHAINKCTDASGQTTFTDQPCPAATRSETLVSPTHSTTTPASKTSTANSGGAVRTIDVNTATEAALSTVVSPTTAGQIVGERSKGRFTDWPDLVQRVIGLHAAQTAFFASLRGLTVGGQSLQGASPNPALADQFEARLRGKP
jgi:DNA uptake protein ComE-like DNA-binding protein